eukprot:CAMPEP_0185848614 /NCGR_PEP_ID=MMETSP1354-20130828/3424_1 /TAXON_ID=708628 /ORGANISM="Erythrolobus madagascarensis, Strain CCMP3276" /LENGTH=135 /DNA_ID=CAMNT_0028549027 /DNA_START=20 /DNA_END=424 /DNA_ORIENTATION=+
MTSARAAALGAAFAREAARVAGKDVADVCVSLGRDSRISGEMLLAAAAAGVTSTGARAINFGIATTPAMFMSTVTPDFEYDGAIMLTASHLPPDRNGMKFFTPRGGASKKTISDLIEDALCSLPVVSKDAFSGLD